MASPSPSPALIIDLEKIPILLQLAKDLSFINILPSKLQDIIVIIALRVFQTARLVHFGVI